LQIYQQMAVRIDVVSRFSRSRGICAVGSSLVLKDTYNLNLGKSCLFRESVDVFPILLT
jgi:hypothetical protein